MEEKVYIKGMGNKPLKNTCRGLEDGRKVMIPPPKCTPIFGGPRNQFSKHHHKIKRYVKSYLVFFSYKRIIHKDNNCRNLEGQEAHVGTIASTTIE